MAESVGFDNLSYFIRSFKAKYKITPGQCLREYCELNAGTVDLIGNIDWEGNVMGDSEFETKDTRELQDNNDCQEQTEQDSWAAIQNTWKDIRDREGEMPQSTKQEKYYSRGALFIFAAICFFFVAPIIGMMVDNAMYEAYWRSQEAAGVTRLGHGGPGYGTIGGIILAFIGSAVMIIIGIANFVEGNRYKR